MDYFMGRFACTSEFPHQKLKVNVDGSFTWDDGVGMFSMHFDKTGKYINQTQEGPYGPEVFVRVGVAPLTREEMIKAKR